MRASHVLIVWAAATVGCTGAPAKYPLEPPLWQDADRRPFAGAPKEYVSPFAWDAANQTVFRPISRFFAVDPGGEAVNVNAWDEVPDSSWFTNRIGRTPMSPEEVANGPCRSPETDPQPPWTVTGAKPNGANPGFMIKDAKGDRYLVKFDGTVQGPRATAADAIASKLFHAAGYTVPCNQVVFFDRGMLKLDSEATAETPSGDEQPLTMAHIDAVLAKGLRLPDGRYRASSSKFLDGKPIGPFTYEGTRDDDPNDVVNHEDRRDLRGMAVLSAWTNHFDSREQNTLAMWIETQAGLGYVAHDLIDFGDCFGSIWEPPMLGRRIGHAHYMDPGYIAEDFITFGIIRRPWDKARFGATDRVFGYYDVALFEADRWRPGYPNPAYSRMTERDAAWMTRIIARFTDAHIDQLVEQGRFHSAPIAAELRRILIGRRDKILRRYFSDLSPLAHPQVYGRTLCFEDLAVSSRVTRPRRYRIFDARNTRVVGVQRTPVAAAQNSPEANVCFELASVAGVSSAKPLYRIFRIAPFNVGPGPLQVHVYDFGRGGLHVAGLERVSG